MAFLLSLCFPCFSPFLISLCSASNPLHPSELREGWCVFYFFTHLTKLLIKPVTKNTNEMNVAALWPFYFEVNVMFEQ